MAVIILSKAKFFSGIAGRLSKAYCHVSAHINHKFSSLCHNPSHFNVHFRNFTINSSSYAKKRQLKTQDIDFKPETLADQEKDVLENNDYEELVHRMQLIPSSEGHQVLIIQPYVKWGPKKNEITTPELMVEEAKALIDSIPNWKCVDSIKVPLESMEKKYVFGTGAFENLQQQISRNPNISAVFVSINLLRGIQRKELMAAFGVPIYDRYSVVLQIFKERAKTREAKLQVAFAEIPYLRSCLVGLQKGERANESGGTSAIGGSGESYYEVQLRLLEKRENKIKAELEKTLKKRALLKSERKKREFPVVAIVGYTNCGKTTLIKALTGDASMEPRDALFATLDVTVHACRLPSKMSVLLVDTVGFISNIPTNLIAAFNSTLRDAIDADIVVHLIDASHPDRENQVATVNDTLKMLDIDTCKTIIQVSNKLDKIPPGKMCTSDAYISAKNGNGLDDLLYLIETKLIEATNRRMLKLLVSSGGEEYRWLHKETTVVKYSNTDDPQYLLLDVLVTPATFGKLRHNFPDIKMLNKK